MTRGLNDNELREGFEIFFSPFLKGYRERVNSLYKEEHAESDSFIYMQPVHLKVLLRTGDAHLLFIKSSIDQLSFIDCSKMDDFPHLLTPTKLTNQFIENHFGITDYLSFNPMSELADDIFPAFSEINRDYLRENSPYWGLRKADTHYNYYGLHKALFDIVKPTSESTVINTQGVIDKVKDPSFTYEFEESVKAYNAGLYLAAAATGGIALENILRILIKRKTNTELPEQTFIKYSLPILKREKVLPSRLYASVNSLNMVRNSNAHTNEDPVKKATVNHLYSVIEDLAFLL